MPMPNIARTQRSFMDMKRFFLTIAALFFIAAVSLFAVSLSELRIIADDGTFLGTLNENAYDSNSIYNEYGTYGSKYNAKSIFNQYGNYGSDYSSLSPFNQYSTSPPGLYDRQGNFYGTLSVNRYARGVTDQTYRLALQLKALRDSL
jgi:hypothetical protein